MDDADDKHVVVTVGDVEDPNAMLPSTNTTATTTVAATTNQVKVMNWQWEDGVRGSGQWRNYGPEQQKRLNQAYSAGFNTVSLVLPEIKRMFEVRGLQGNSPEQENEATGTKRSVRYRPIDAIPHAVPVAIATTADPVVLSTVAAAGNTTASVSAPTMSRDAQDICDDVHEFMAIDYDEFCDCYEDNDKDACKEACNCIDRDEDRELPCGGGVLGFIVVLPFLPFALAWLLLKWTLCKCGPVIIIAVSLKIVLMAVYNALCLFIYKLAHLVYILFRHCVYRPFKTLGDLTYVYVLTPIGHGISWVGENVVKPTCEMIARAVAWICENVVCATVTFVHAWILKPTFLAISNCVSFVWNNVLVPFGNAISGCVTYVCNGVRACCVFVRDNIFLPLFHAISSCVAYVWNSVMVCCWFLWDNIFLPLFLAIWTCVTYASNAISTCAAFVCNGLYNCVTFIYNSIFVPIGTCITATAGMVWSNVFVPIGNAIASCIQALYTHVVSPIFGAIWSVLVFVGGIVYLVSATVGNAVWSVAEAIGVAIYTVLAAVGNAVAAVFNALPC